MITPTEKYFEYLEETGNEFNQVEYEVWLEEATLEELLTEFD